MDALVRDALAALEVLDGEVLTGGADGVDLLAVVARQMSYSGTTAGSGSCGPWPVTVSTVDPQARHGQKSRTRRFDGAKDSMPLAQHHDGMRI